jgi:hypothetical protein
MSPDLDPRNITLRESRDSDINPVTRPVVWVLDVTGSMGPLAEQLAKKGIGQLFEELISRQVVIGPQVAVGGFGDVAAGDRAPLQLTQFESDTASLVPQVEKLWLEGGGGGNSSESTNLAWYATLTRVSHDAFERRGEKGYLITVGDEECPPDLTPDQITRVFGSAPQSAPTNAQMLDALSTQWHVIHLMVEEGQHMRLHTDAVKRSWQQVLGQMAVPLSDISKMSEVIVSLIEVIEGRDADVVATSWSGSTALVVGKALEGVKPGAKSVARTGGTGIVRF